MVNKESLLKLLQKIPTLKIDVVDDKIRVKHHKNIWYIYTYPKYIHIKPLMYFIGHPQSFSIVEEKNDLKVLLKLLAELKPPKER